MITAYHEAGHILLAEWFSARVVYASVLPEEHQGVRSHGLTRAVWPPATDPRQRSAELAKVALAGPAAELIYTDEQYEPRVLQEWWTDWLAAGEAIQAIAPHPLNDEQKYHILSAYLQSISQFLSKDRIWDRIAGIAEELDAHETLETMQLIELREQGRLAV